MMNILPNEFGHLILPNIYQSRKGDSMFSLLRFNIDRNKIAKNIPVTVKNEKYKKKTLNVNKKQKNP